VVPLAASVVNWQWWLDNFVRSSFWKAARARFMPLACEQTLPLSLWLSFELRERDRLLAVLECLKPTTTLAAWKELAMWGSFVLPQRICRRFCARSSIGTRARSLGCRISYRSTRRTERLVEWDGKKARVRQGALTRMKHGEATNFAFIEPMKAPRVTELPVGD
jgi:hypothetical protein